MVPSMMMPKSMAPMESRFAASAGSVQENEREKQRERDRQRRDDGSAKAHQEKKEDEQNQHHAAKKISFHRIGGDAHQVAAIVVGTNFDVRRKDVAIRVRRFLSPRP